MLAVRGELRRADGLAALLHRVRPGPAHRHGVHPVRPSRRPATRSSPSTARRADPRLHLRRRRGRREHRRRDQTSRPGTVLNVAGGSNVSVNETLGSSPTQAGHPLRVEHTESVKGDVVPDRRRHDQDHRRSAGSRRSPSRRASHATSPGPGRRSAPASDPPPGLIGAVGRPGTPPPRPDDLPHAGGVHRAASASRRRPPHACPYGTRGSTDDPSDHPVHRPVGRPAVRGGRPPRLRLGLRRPRDRVLGRPPRPLGRRRGRAYVQGKLDMLERYGLQVYAISNHLKGQAVCDDPIDARHQRHPVRAGSGATATRRASGSGPPRR